MDGKDEDEVLILTVVGALIGALATATVFVIWVRRNF